MIVRAFRGSPFKFSHFKDSASGIHFGTFEQAAHAATKKLAHMPLREFERLEEINGWRGSIYECELILKNPKRVKDRCTPQAWSRAIKSAALEGFDSLVYKNEFEGTAAQDSYCLFDAQSVRAIAIMERKTDDDK